MHRACIGVPQSRAVEQTEAHRAIPRRMMTGRAHGTESVAQPSRLDFVHRPNRCARGPQRGLAGSLRHGRVGIEVNMAQRLGLGGRPGQNVVGQAPGVGPQKIGVGGAPGIDPDQILKMASLERPKHRPETVRTFRVSHRRSMAETGRMGNESCPHGASQLRPVCPVRQPRVERPDATMTSVWRGSFTKEMHKSHNPLRNAGRDAIPF